jgi:hypothetical protein
MINLPTGSTDTGVDISKSVYSDNKRTQEYTEKNTG